MSTTITPGGYTRSTRPQPVAESPTEAPEALEVPTATVTPSGNGWYAVEQDGATESVRGRDALRARLAGTRPITASGDAFEVPA